MKMKEEKNRILSMDVKCLEGKCNIIWPLILKRTNIFQTHHFHISPLVLAIAERKMPKSTILMMTKSTIYRFIEQLPGLLDLERRHFSKNLVLQL